MAVWAQKHSLYPATALAFILGLLPFGASTSSAQALARSIGVKTSVPKKLTMWMIRFHI